MEVIVYGNTLKDCELVIEKGLNTFYEVGEALTIIRDNKLYKDTNLTFESYCLDKWGIKRNYANKLISSSTVINNLLDGKAGTIVPKAESQAREISKAEPEDQAEVWLQAQEETGKEQPTAQEIKKVVQGQHSATNSDDEYNTPLCYIGSARRVMGSIDFDPASNDEAQKTVNAIEYCTIDNSSLTKPFWMGNVWMNPPYSRIISEFCEKLVLEVENGNVQQAITLTNNGTDTKWFHELAGVSSAICLHKGRIGFLKNGIPTDNNNKGQAIIYIGKNTDAFATEFSKYGAVYVK